MHPHSCTITRMQEYIYAYTDEGTTEGSHVPFPQEKAVITDALTLIEK